MSDKTFIMPSIQLNRAMRKHYTIYNNSGCIATHVDFETANKILIEQTEENWNTLPSTVVMLRDASVIGAIKRGHLTIVACGI